MKFIKTHFKFSGRKFLGKLVHRPLLLFLALLLLEGVVAAAIFFNFKEQYLSGKPGVGGITMTRPSIFGSNEEKDYRNIFSILENKEKEYLNAGAIKYPDIF